MNNLTKPVDKYLESLRIWQQGTLSHFRKVVHVVAPDVVEEIKWNVPIFLVNKKMYFAMSAFKAHVKYNFIRNGALLEDLNNLFNNGFDSAKSRAIDIREGESVDHEQLQRLIVVSISK